MRRRFDRIVIGLALEPAVFEAVEDDRGRLNRSKYVNSVLKKTLGMKVGK